MRIGYWKTVKRQLDMAIEQGRNCLNLPHCQINLTLLRISDDAVDTLTLTEGAFLPCARIESGGMLAVHIKSACVAICAEGSPAQVLTLGFLELPQMLEVPRSWSWTLAEPMTSDIELPQPKGLTD